MHKYGAYVCRYNNYICKTKKLVLLVGSLVKLMTMKNFSDQAWDHCYDF
jgi:hypothetical protein